MTSPNDILIKDIPLLGNAVSGDYLVGERVAGTTVRVVYQNDVQSVRYYGAKGDGVTDDTAAIQTAINAATAAPNGGKVYIPEGIYLVSNTLTVSAPITIYGDGIGSVISVQAGMSTSLDVLSLAFGNTAINWGAVLHDFSIQPNNTSSSPARDAIRVIVPANFGVFKFSMQRVYIFNPANINAGVFTGHAFYISNPTPNHNGFPHATIEDCMLGSGFYGQWIGDSVTIKNNLIFGPNVGIETSQISGASHLVIENNNITSIGGAIVIHSGVNVKIIRNQLEQVLTQTGSSTSNIWLQGDAGPILEAEIIGNNINSRAFCTGGGIHITTASYVMIDANLMEVVTPVPHIYTDTGALGTDIKANNVYYNESGVTTLILTNNSSTTYTTTGTKGPVLSTSPTITTPLLYNPVVYDATGHPELAFTSTASAVNYINITNNATGNGPSITAAGSDSNILLSLSSKGNLPIYFLSTDAAPIVIESGSAYQHVTSLAFANAATTQTITFPDGNYTVMAVGGAIGTPSSGTLTNCTGLPIATGVSGLGTGVATFLATPSGANFAAALTTPVPLSDGGTNANLTASNGGIVYSTASAQAILAGTATANQMLMSGSSTAPVWSTSTYPLTNAANTLLYASSANTMAALATANSSVLITNSSGVPSLSTTLPSGLAATNLSLTTPALGTPSAGTLTSCTGLPISTGVSGLGTGVATFLATPSSANLASALTTSTGSGNNVFATSPTITTPNVVGTTAAGNASAGSVGEVISSQVLFGSAVSITTATATNITSISLTAGDWDVFGNVLLNASVGMTEAFASINTTSATLGDNSLASGTFATTATFTYLGYPVATQRINVSGTTTVYLVGFASFASGTCTGCGIITARRRR